MNSIAVVGVEEPQATADALAELVGSVEVVDELRKGLAAVIAAYKEAAANPAAEEFLLAVEVLINEQSILMKQQVIETIQAYMPAQKLAS